MQIDKQILIQNKVDIKSEDIKFFQKVQIDKQILRWDDVCSYNAQSYMACQLKDGDILQLHPL